MNKQERLDRAIWLRDMAMLFDEAVQKITEKAETQVEVEGEVETWLDNAQALYCQYTRRFKLYNMPLIADAETDEELKDVAERTSRALKEISDEYFMEKATIEVIKDQQIELEYIVQKTKNSLMNGSEIVD